MLHETGNGTSMAIVKQNNPGGLMNSSGTKLLTFETLDRGIEATVKNLKVNYIDCGLDSIELIQKKYAPVDAENDNKGLNKHWLNKVQYYYDLLQN